MSGTRLPEFAVRWGLDLTSHPCIVRHGSTKEAKQARRAEEEVPHREERACRSVVPHQPSPRAHLAALPCLPLLCSVWAVPHVSSGFMVYRYATTTASSAVRLAATPRSEQASRRIPEFQTCARTRMTSFAGYDWPVVRGRVATSLHVCLTHCMLGSCADDEHRRTPGRVQPAQPAEPARRCGSCTVSPFPAQSLLLTAVTAEQKAKRMSSKQQMADLAAAAGRSAAAYNAKAAATVCCVHGCAICCTGLTCANCAAHRAPITDSSALPTPCRPTARSISTCGRL